MSNDNYMYRFAGFELDTAARTLRAQGRPLAIQPRPFDLLRYLIEHRDRVVSRAELMSQVWGVRVGPQALGYAVHAVRRTLADDGTQQSLLRTVRGLGLQFVAPVECGPSPLTGDRLRVRDKEPPLLGREQLVILAEEALDAARTGEGQLLFLHGEAGIGKTRAIEHIASMALRARFQVFGGRCAVGEGELAFSPWRQIIQAATSGHTLESLSATLGVAPADIAWIAAPIESGAALQHDDPWKNKERRTRLFDVVRSLIARVAAEAPVFLSLDDIHRADPASLELLSYLGPGLRDLPILLVAGYRDTDRDELSTLWTKLSGGSAPARLQHHELGGLNTTEVKTLVEALSNVDVQPEFASGLMQRTNGNPFFVTLLLNVLMTQNRVGDLGGADLEALALPERVHEAVLLQLRDLPRAAIKALELASTAGREFQIADLECALDIDRKPLIGLLEPALRAHIIGKSVTPGSYEFVHSLVREAILSSLNERKRASHHGLLANGIEKQLKGREWLRASELAHHCVEAIPVIGTDAAIRYLELAADWASQHMGFEEAAGYLEGLENLRASVSSATVRCRHLIKLGSAQNRLGRRSEAHTAFYQATSLARKAGLGDYFATAALLYSPDFLSLETGVVDHEHTSILKEVLENPETRQDIMALVSARLGVALHWSDESLPEALEYSRKAVSLASKGSGRYVNAYVETASRFTQFAISEPEALVSTNPYGSLNGAPLNLLVARVLRVTGFWLLGEMGKLRTEIEEFSGASRQLRELRAEWYEWLWKSALALMEGRYRAASMYQERFAKLGGRAGDQNASHSLVLQRFLTSVDTSEVEPFGDSISEMIEKYPRVVGWRAGRLHYILELDRLEEAGDLLSQLVHEDAIAKPRRNEWYGLAAAMAIASARLQDARFGQVLYEILTPLRGHLAVMGYGSYCYGSVSHLTGLCAFAFGDFALARQEFERAICANRAVGALPAVARVLVDHSAAEGNAGNRGKARELAEEAARLCSRLGMRRLWSKAEQLA